MCQCRHGTGRKLPLKAEHDVGEDQQQRYDQRESALLGQFLANLWTDSLYTAQLELVAACRERLLQPLAHYVGVDVELWRQAHEDIGLLAKLLYLCILEARAFEALANVVEIGRLRIADFEQDATSKVDTKVEAAYRQRRNRRDNDEY